MRVPLVDVLCAGQWTSSDGQDRTSALMLSQVERGCVEQWEETQVSHYHVVSLLREHMDL